MKNIILSFITQRYCPSFTDSDVTIAHWWSLKSWNLIDYLLFPAFLKDPKPILILEAQKEESIYMSKLNNKKSYLLKPKWVLDYVIFEEDIYIKLYITITKCSRGCKSKLLDYQEKENSREDFNHLKMMFTSISSNSISVFLCL